MVELIDQITDRMMLIDKIALDIISFESLFQRGCVILVKSF